MQLIQSKIASCNWQNITEEMHSKGYALIPDLLTKEHCKELIDTYTLSHAYRKTVVMERYRFGVGEYKYYNYPLPDDIQTLRLTIYSHLVPIANTWMSRLNFNNYFPHTHQELLQQCQEADQNQSTVLLLKYSKGGYNTLHQDLYGEVFFPIQIVLFLNQPDEEYTGGEFVLLQQAPRAQAKAVVLKPRKGDMLIFTTAFYPVKGAKGYYRATVKHGVSEIHSGIRHTLGIIFHDALH